MLATHARLLSFGTGLALGLTALAVCEDCRAADPEPAATTPDAGPATKARTNRPPEFERPHSESESKPLRQVGIRAGKTLHIPVSAIDPDGDDISYRVNPLPAFARFDAEARAIVLAPKTKDFGSHPIVIEASDGHAAGRLNLVVSVFLNRAPSTDVQDVLIRGAGTGDHPIRLFEDNDGDSLKIVSQRLPARASIDHRGSYLILQFAPTEADVGVHPLEVSVTDGESVSSIHTTLVVLAGWSHRGWATSLVPVVGTSAFLTHSGDGYAGGIFDLTLRARRRRGSEAVQCALGQTYDGECFTGQFRIYSSFELLSSDSANSLFGYALGYEGAFESFPNRRYAIPFHELEIGGLYQADLGHRPQVRAALGVWLWSDDSVWISAALGYRVAPSELSALSGGTLALRAQFNPW